jgi:uncharacterized metal-binding protein
VVAGASFTVATLLLSPDLDLKHSRITKNWGVLSPLWWGYHKSFKHRGLSHSIFLSSLSRLAYLFLVGMFLLVCFHLFSDLMAGSELKSASKDTQEWLFDLVRRSYLNLVENKQLCGAVAAGIVVSDWMHILFDRSLTASKSIFGRGLWPS